MIHLPAVVDTQEMAGQHFMHKPVLLGIIPANCWRAFYMDADEYAHAQLPLPGRSHSFLAVIVPKLTNSRELGPGKQCACIGQAYWR